MKKWFVIIPLFVVCVWALNVFLMRKHKQENDRLLANSIKSEQLNITLIREIFETKPHEIYYMRDEGEKYDSLQLLTDLFIKHYPKLNPSICNAFKRIQKYFVPNDSFDVVKLLKSSTTQQHFELSMLIWLNELRKNHFTGKLTVCFDPLVIEPQFYETPVGVPIKFYIEMYGRGLLDLSKNFVSKSPIKIDPDNKYTGYIQADKVGTYIFSGKYNKIYMGDTMPMEFAPFEYYVTEPKIQSKLIDKEFLTIHQDNRIAFDFGQYKKKDIAIVVEGVILNQQPAIITLYTQQPKK